MKRHFSKKFTKKLKKYQQDVQDAVIDAIWALPDGDVVKMSGIDTDPPTYRLRVGKYRVICRMNDEDLYLDKIDSRGDVYKK